MTDWWGFQNTTIAASGEWGDVKTVGSEDREPHVPWGEREPFDGQRETNASASGRVFW